MTKSIHSNEEITKSVHFEDTVGVPIQRSLTGVSQMSQKSQTTSSFNPWDPELQIQFRTLSIQTQEQVDNGIELIQDHLLTIEQLCVKYSTSLTLGLENDQLSRLVQGKNKITPPKPRWVQKILGYIFGGFNTLMWIAFIVTILSYYPFGDPPAIFNLGVAILLMLVIMISAFFYAYVDYSAGKVMNSIKNLLAQEAQVLRNGTILTIPSQNLILGDIVILSMGTKVPADLRLIEQIDAKFDRSILTGEADAIPGTIDSTNDNPLETRNLALSGTFMVQGHCRGIVIAIGDDTVMGKVASLSLGQKEERTTLQREIHYFTLIISGLAVSLFLAAMLAWTFWLRVQYPGFLSISQAIVNAIGCLTAFVPQSLPICVALSLLIVARRMAQQQILVKNLATVETLGSMNVLLSDKTGTLTEGKMFVRRLGFFNGEFNLAEAGILNGLNGKGLDTLHEIAGICNAAQFDPKTLDYPVGQRIIMGDPTDSAVLRFAEELGSVEVLRDNHVVLYTIPFNSKTKWMACVVQNRETLIHKLLLKGGPDVLFPYCENMMSLDGSIVKMGEQVVKMQTSWASQGQRVLALTEKVLESVENLDEEKMMEFVLKQIQGLTLVGLVGIFDPPRSSVPGAIQVMKKAGVRVAMVTGDFSLTALAIARMVGIVGVEKVDTVEDLKGRYQEYEGKRFDEMRPGVVDEEDVEKSGYNALVISGDEIGKLSELDWNVIVGYYHQLVFARTTPEQKLKIVLEFKKRGDNTVAVTGDGVNDSAALRAANIGVAMGSGSDVAKEAAKMVLLNSDFASIPVAIEMGRLVFDNLKKVLLLLMPAGTYTEFMTVFGNIFLGMPIALSSYLMVIYCVTNDVAMSFSLMHEKSEQDLMNRPPRNANKDRLTDWKFFVQIYLFIGLMMWPSAMGMFFWYMQSQGITFGDIMFSFNQWTDGYLGMTIDELNLALSGGQTVYYITMVIMQIGALLAIRGRRVSILKNNPFWGKNRNYWVPIGVAISLSIALINVYGPGIQQVFGTTIVPYQYWLAPFGIAAGILIMDELRKYGVRQGWKIVEVWAW